MRSWLARRSAAGAPTLLADLWYSHAVGHAIEALRTCQAYHAGSPELRIGLVLNGAAPTELAACAPFVDAVYPVSYTSFGTPEGSPRAALRGIPRDWDHVVHHAASVDDEQLRFEGLQRYYRAARRHFRARVAEGVAGREPPTYVPHQRLRLELPTDARRAAEDDLGGRLAIAVMPAGSSGRRALYPSTTSWLMILGRLSDAHPGVAFVFLGRHAAADARTTSGIGRDELARLVAACDGIDAFDRPILEQLALVESSSLFLSPHTGFGFAAVAVGTPWLALSGGDWHEHFFNGVPFHSVLPKRATYPVFVRGGDLPVIDADDDGEGPRVAAMSAARFRDDLDEIAEAADRLVARTLPYEEALAAYFPRLLEAYGGDRAKVRTFEDVDRQYL